MTEQTDVSLSSCKRTVKKGRSESVEGLGDGSEDVVQDQVIIAPEIMRMILEYLDLRGLKQVRLVCKSWLREAQIHMERRGVVCLSSVSSATRIQEFVEMRKKKLPTLPQPFKSIDLDLNAITDNDQELLPCQLSSLSPPLVITRFLPNHMQLGHALRLIIQYSASLEHVELRATTCEEGDLLLMKPEQIFPKLQSLAVEISLEEGSRGNHFPSVVAWIAKSSPKLEIYESRSYMSNGATFDVVNELVLQVDIKNLKAFRFYHYNLSDAAAEHLSSISFSQLEELEMSIDLRKDLVKATVANVATTLRKLDLYWIQDEEDVAEFPTCPYVQEVLLCILSHWDGLISSVFPSLQIVHVFMVDLPMRGDTWGFSTPLTSVKELQVLEELPSCGCSYDEEFELTPAVLSSEDFGFSHSQTVIFLGVFSGLERLRISGTFLLHCCRLRATGNPKYSNLLEGVKHLEIESNCKCWDGSPQANDYSSLGVLKGIESIQAKIEAITTIPAKEMTGLKVIRFPWGDELEDVDGLVEMARAVEKVVVTNCCSIPRTQDARCNELLNRFFDSAPNAECGCKERKPPSFTFVR